MQPTPQPELTHDAIVALLRDHPPRAGHDPSELNISPGRDEPAVTTAPSIEPVAEPVIETVAVEPPAPVVPPPFETMSKTPSVEPMTLAPPAEPPLRASPSSDISMDAELHPPPARPGHGLLRFVTLVFVGILATIGWQVYGETARETVAGLGAQMLTAAPTQQANAAEPQAAVATEATPPVQAAAAPPAPAAPPPAEPAQAQAAIPPDAAQKMEAMSREIASLKQTVEQLKASQLQMNRDLAKTMEHQVKQKSAAPPAKQTSVPQPQPQRAAVMPPPQPQPVAAAPVPAPPQQQPNYGQPQMYGQSRVYDRPPTTYGRSPDEPYARPYSRNYDSADADRDVYVPPPSPNYSPGYVTVPRPPAPMQ